MIDKLQALWIDFYDRFDCEPKMVAAAALGFCLGAVLL